MSLAIQGEGSSLQPGKRRRGRPCRDPSLNHAEAVFTSPVSNGVKQFLPRTSDRTFGSNSMLGQSVTGFVEATFDAGYLLSVRIGDSNACLRGIVFKPGYYAPITPANDVAPHLPMIHRSDINFSPGNLAFFHAPVAAPKRKYTSKKDATPTPAPASGSGSGYAPVDYFAVQSLTRMQSPGSREPVSKILMQEEEQKGVTESEIHTNKHKETFSLGTNSFVFPEQDNSRRTNELSLFNDRVAGRMTELLQAVEENTADN